MDNHCNRDILERTLQKERGRGNYSSPGCLENRITKGRRSNYWRSGDFDTIN
jgi:hypothetical protein